MLPPLHLVLGQVLMETVVPGPWVSYLRVEEQWARKCIEGSGDIDLLVRTSRGS